MRHALAVAAAVAVTGCGGGGISPELYALVLNTVTIPASCFTVAPTDMVTKGPLGTTTVTVWDAPEGKAFLSPDTSLSFDMGDAPTVSVSSAQALEGVSSTNGWSFVAETDFSDVQNVLGGTRTVNSKTKLELIFPRAATGTGTLALSSSSSCTGAGCGTTMPTCAISGIPMRTSKLAVDFERTP